MRILKSPDARDLHRVHEGRRVVSGRSLVTQSADGGRATFTLYDEREGISRGVLGEVVFFGPEESGTYDEYRLRSGGDIERHALVEHGVGTRRIDEDSIDDATGMRLASSLHELVDRLDSDGAQR